jgi:hypothetical protein
MNENKKQQNFVDVFVQSAFRNANIIEPSKEETETRYQQLISPYSYFFTPQEVKTKLKLVDFVQSTVPISCRYILGTVQTVELIILKLYP